MSRVLIVSFALLSILAILSGCSQAPATTAAPATPTGSGYPAPAVNPTTDTGYPAPTTPEAPTAYPAPIGNGIQVVASDGTTKTVSATDLNDLPQAKVSNESGPKLIDVLQLANIFDFTSVTITGSNGSKDLTKAQVTDQVILGLANGTVTLVMNGTPQDQWIKDVNLITVK